MRNSQFALDDLYILAQGKTGCASEASGAAIALLGILFT